MFDLYIHSSAKSGSDSHGTNKSNIQRDFWGPAEMAFFNTVSQ